MIDCSVEFQGYVELWNRSLMKIVYGLMCTWTKSLRLTHRNFYRKHSDELIKEFFEKIKHNTTQSWRYPLSVHQANEHLFCTRAPSFSFRQQIEQMNGIRERKILHMRMKRIRFFFLQLLTAPLKPIWVWYRRQKGGIYVHIVHIYIYSMDMRRTLLSGASGGRLKPGIGK